MATYKTKRIIPMALILIIVAIVIAALVSLARVFLFPASDTSVSQSDIIKEALLNTSADQSVSMTTRGPIVADENFRSYKIQITPNERKLIRYKGYLDQTIDNVVLGNNIPAYEEFVYALDKANFMKGTEFTGAKNDLRGICATGYVYEFRVLKSDESIKQLWTSSCSVSRGSLSAKIDHLKKLFFAQIPDSKLLISRLWR